MTPQWLLWLIDNWLLIAIPVLAFLGSYALGLWLRRTVYNAFNRWMAALEKEVQAEALHSAGKLMAVHMDGRLRALKELIAGTAIDIVEAFHPPPMGDLALSEALALWKDKAVWVGFPGSVYALGPQTTVEFALELLREAVPGERLVLEMSTENLVSNENLLALTSVLEHAELPLTPELIEQIARHVI